MEGFHYLYDLVEETNVRYVSFVSDNARFDLAIIHTDRFFGKTLVLDIQASKFAIVGRDDLDEPGYLEYAFGITEAAAEDLKEFLSHIVI